MLTPKFPKISQTQSLPLNKTLQQAVQHMAAVAHQANVLRCAVHTLAVQDGPLKHVAELLTCAEEVGPDKVYHAPVLDEVVLQRVTGQDDSAPGTDVLQGLRCAGMIILNAMTLVTDHHIWARPCNGPFNTFGHSK